MIKFIMESANNLSLLTAILTILLTSFLFKKENPNNVIKPEYSINMEQGHMSTDFDKILILDFIIILIIICLNFIK